MRIARNDRKIAMNTNTIGKRTIKQVYQSRRYGRKTIKPNIGYSLYFDLYAASCPTILAYNNTLKMHQYAHSVETLQYATNAEKRAIRSAKRANTLHKVVAVVNSSVNELRAIVLSAIMFTIPV